MSVSRLPTRIFGPVTRPCAAELAEMIRDDDSTGDTLERFLCGEISCGQLAYEIQIIAEGHDQRLARAYADDHGDMVRKNEVEGVLI